MKPETATEAGLGQQRGNCGGARRLDKITCGESWPAESASRRTRSGGAACPAGRGGRRGGSSRGSSGSMRRS